MSLRPYDGYLKPWLGHIEKCLDAGLKPQQIASMLFWDMGARSSHLEFRALGKHPLSDDDQIRSMAGLIKHMMRPAIDKKRPRPRKRTIRFTAWEHWTPEKQYAEFERELNG